VGRQIVNLLAASPAVRRLVVVNRRQTDEFKGNLKVREVVVPDMDTLPKAVEAEATEARATVAFAPLVSARAAKAQGGAFPTPVVKFYEYSDMKTLFNRDDPAD